MVKMAEDARRINEENTPKRKSFKNAKRFSYISIIFMLSILLGGIIWQYNAEQSSNYQGVKLKAGFIHSNEGYNPILFDKLNLDEQIIITPIKEQDVQISTLDNLDTVIISNVDLSDSSRTYLAQYLAKSQDHSVIVFLGENSDGADLKFLNITNSENLPSFQGENLIGYGICKPTENVPELTQNIPWNSMPEVRNYTLLTESDFNSSDASTSSVILKDYSSKDSNDVFLYYKDLQKGGNVLLYTIWFEADLNLNEITESFPYLGYFFYSSYMYLQNIQIPSYAAWPYSPVPHLFDLIILALVFGSLGILSIVAFIYVRNYSEKNPLPEVVALETEEEIQAKLKAKEKVDHLEELRSETEKFVYEEVEEELPEHLQKWESVGLHKQIGGWWTLFFLMLVLILPLGVFFLWMFPALVFPSPSGQGFYKFASDFFNAVWVFADLGTSYWMTRKFAAYRVNEPKKAIQSAQCFIWYQMISGGFQVIFIGFLGGIIFPETIYAHLTYVFVWHSLFQWMGFFLVFVNILNGLQRIDMAGVGAAAVAPLLLVVQMVVVPFFVAWGSSNPMIGIALGGAIGSGIANFFTNLILLVVSWWAFKKTFGFSGLTIFRVDFDWEMMKDMLSFGFKIALGQVTVPIVWTLQVTLLSIYLDNYSNWLGYWNLAMTVGTISSVLGLFAGTLLPALSEAQENDKPTLMRYDLVAMLKWTNNFNFWLHSALFAVFVPIILAITPAEFQPVASLMPLILIYQIIGPYSWLGDNIFTGLNHPKFARNVWFLEQGIRALLMVILIPLLAGDPVIGIFSMLFAYIPALAIKDIAVWTLVKKRIAPNIKFYPFKTFVAPGIAGIIFYLLTAGIVAFSGGGLVGAIIAALFALVIGPFVYFFISGVCGGWSENGLEEFNRSIEIMTVAKKIGKGLYRCCEYGAKLSPWKEKGNIDIYLEAQKEAWQLTLEKKKVANF